MSIAFSFKFIGRDFDVIHSGHHTEIWESGDDDALVSLPLPIATERECHAAVTGYFRGRSLGEKRGQSDLQRQLRKLLGVPPV